MRIREAYRTPAPARPVLLLLTALLFSACNPKVIYDDTKELPGGVWSEDITVRFDVEINSADQPTSFYLNVRHTTDYGYANLYLFISTTYPNGELARDTVECMLADRSGKWLGKGITNIRDNQVLLRRGLRFPVNGTYIFEIEQAMREPLLEGITDIGLRIVKD